MEKDVHERFFERMERLMEENQRGLAELRLRSAENERILNEKFAETGRNIDKLSSESRGVGEYLAEVGRNVDSLSSESRGVGEYLAEVGRNIDSLGNKYEGVNERVEGIAKSNGQLAEEYFINALKGNFVFAGMNFVAVDCPANRTMGMPDGKRLHSEFDVVMTSPDAVAVIEIKYRAKTGDLDDLADRKIKNFRTLYPEYAHRSLYLGVASMSFNKHVVKRAKELGIGLIRQVGEAVEYGNDWAVRPY